MKIYSEVNPRKMANRRKVKRNQKSKTSKKNNDRWKLHDIYPEGVCYNRVVTRSQVAFLLIRNTESDTELFADSTKHHPPKMTHLLNTLKGEYGAMPRTKITRQLAVHIKVSESLCTVIDGYKTVIIPVIKDDVGKKAVPDKTNDKYQADSTGKIASKSNNEKQGQSKEKAPSKFTDEKQGELNVSSKTDEEKQEENVTKSGEGITSYFQFW